MKVKEIVKVVLYIEYILRKMIVKVGKSRMVENLYLAPKMAGFDKSQITQHRPERHQPGSSRGNGDGACKCVNVKPGDRYQVQVYVKGK